MLPALGFGVLAWINAAAFGTLFFINYLLVKQVGYGVFINLKLIIAVILLCATVVVLSYLLYQYSLVRYCIITVAVIAAFFVIFKYRHKVIKLVKIKLHRKSEK